MHAMNISMIIPTIQLFFFHHKPSVIAIILASVMIIMTIVMTTTFMTNVTASARNNNCHNNRHEVNFNSCDEYLFDSYDIVCMSYLVEIIVKITIKCTSQQSP